MTLVAPPSPPPSGKRAEHIYPILTPAQLARIAPHGRRRHVEQGEVLVQAGESAARFFIVVAGRIDVIRPSATEEVVVSFSPGMFTGEATMLSGRRGLAQVRAGMDGEVRSEEHTSELQSLAYLVCRLLLEKKKKKRKAEILHTMKQS